MSNYINDKKCPELLREEKSKSRMITIISVIALSSILIGAIALQVVKIPSTGFTPTIDGNIESGWERADYKISQYVDVNNTNGDIDAINYYYIDEAENDFNIAIDITSKTTNETDGEWIGLWFSTLNISETMFGFNESEMMTEFFGLFQFDYLLGDGTEYLVYDIDNETVYTFLKEDAPINSYSDSIDETYLTINAGSIIDPLLSWEDPNEWASTETEDTTECIISSEQDVINADIKDHVLLNFSIDINDLFYIPEGGIDELLSTMENIELEYEIPYILGQNPTSQFDYDMYNQNDMELCNLWVENNGTYNNAEIQITSTNQIITINKSAVLDGYINFSIEVYNSTFNPKRLDLWIDYIHLSFDYEYGYDYLYGKSTIEDFDVSIGFGTSPNSNINHRTIELSIPKIELGYNESEGILNVFVQGGGIPINSNEYEDPIRMDEYYTNARDLITSYTFTDGIQGYGYDNGGIYYIIWCPLTPIWSKNYICFNFL